MQWLTISAIFSLLNSKATCLKSRLELENSIVTTKYRRYALSLSLYSNNSYLCSIRNRIYYKPAGCKKQRIRKS